MQNIILCIRTWREVRNFAWQRPSSGRAVANSALGSKRLVTPGLHELNRQSQPSRGGRHICELQDQPLAFCERFGASIIFYQKSKYIDVVFMSDGRWSEKVHGWIAKDNAVLHELCSSSVLAVLQFSFFAVSSVVQFKNYAVLQFSSSDNAVLHELYLSVVTKRELSNTAKLSIFK